jgi:hypothetical protein
MNRPDDIPEWAWEKARAEIAQWSRVMDFLPIDKAIICEGVSRALMAAERRGAERENEECAKVADEHERYWNDAAYDRRQNAKDDSYACACANSAMHLATAIRARMKP